MVIDIGTVASVNVCQVKNHKTDAQRCTLVQQLHLLFLTKKRVGNINKYYNGLHATYVDNFRLIYR